MNEIIKEQLNKIEKEHQVNILYACEAGSRSWGGASADSDFDIRFIYMHKKEWYLTLDKNKDSMEMPLEINIDCSGWELTKALRLFRKSNPSIFEWLQSNTIYIQSDYFIKKLHEINQIAFNPRACFYYYLNTAKKNFQNSLQKDKFTLKKYFYVLRPIFACCWIKKYQTMPPNDFAFLMDELLSAGRLKSEIGQLLQEKRSGDGGKLLSKIPIIHDYIERELEELENVLPIIQGGQVNERELTLFLDDLFRELLIP
ncbi:MAG: nucleotidyltransferase domain-containing protein [Bacillus sp. (in: firmicutes)]